MDTPSKIAYSVTADSTGGRAGTSSVPALGISHVMRMPKELGGPGDGPNPEALFAMGYGACFQGAMGLAATDLGIDTKDSVVRTTIGLGPEGDSFALTADIEVFIPGVELDRAQALVERAECIDSRPMPTSTVRIPRRVAVIGPIVVPHGIALLPTKLCEATPAAAHARFHRAMPSPSVA